MAAEGGTPVAVAVPPALHRPFRVVVFDWDGTAVPDRATDAAPVRARVAALTREGVHVVVVTGTSFENLHRQLTRDLPPAERGGVLLAADRGSTLWAFGEDGEPRQVAARRATPEEDARLDEVADRVVAALGPDLGAVVIRDRVNRRKVDLLPVWRDPPKAEIAALLDAVERRLRDCGVTGGLEQALGIAEHVVAERLPGARITTDAKHLEIGLTDKAAAVAAALGYLPPDIDRADVLVLGDELGPLGGRPGSDAHMLAAARGAVAVSVGVEPGGVPAGVTHVPGGPAAFLAVLDGVLDAVERIGPLPAHDPAWTLVEEGFRLEREHEVESILAVANGALGVRASLGEGTPLSRPATLIAGLFRGNPVPRLVRAPDWTALRITADGAPLSVTRATRHRRVLDLRRGILWREWVHRDEVGRVTRVRAARIASMADRRVALESVLVAAENYNGSLRVDLSADPVEPWTREDGGWAVGDVGFAVARDVQTDAGERVVAVRDEGGCAYVTGIEAGRSLFAARACALAGGPAEALSVAEAALAGGPGLAIRRHAVAWQARWRDAEIEVAGDPEAERALRFAAYHLLSAANPGDPRVSIGARTLTGPAYLGHVFWDTEVYMLPFFCAAWPEAARALLLYRHRTLPAARARAAAGGWRGALWAWESADTGEDVTPRGVYAPDGVVVPIRSGEQEHHITAAIAWAAWRYWTWTRDEVFLRDAGAEMLLEAARFWASRGRLEADGRFHVRGAMGPDEYHAGVDDDAYTNGMARWCLERGVEVAGMVPATRLGFERDEIEAWAALAPKVADGLDPASGVIEQFAGYFALADLDLTGRPPGAPPLDVLLGHDAIARTRAVKQADVVLLLYLLAERIPPAVRGASFRFYEPRTAHTSSLSPPIHAIVAARLGLVPTALRYFRQTAAIDLALGTGNAAGGVHAAALGGLWQAATFGFAGLAVDGERLSVDPKLPEGWTRLRFPVRFRGRRFVVTATPDGGAVEEAP
ncbi:MAG: glycosyl hydrolase family 65 protein [Myxococcota bacterium]